MTVPVSVQEVIRRLDAQGVAGREIARRLGVARNTVAKYVGVMDYSPRPRVVRGGSKTAPFAGVVESWLLADEGMPRKQRHTAKRVFDRLVVEEGFTGSYSSVQRWVKAWRAQHRVTGEGFAELAWAPGIAQVDYGTALAVIAGRRMQVHALVVSWPASNMRHVVALPAENA